MKRLILTFCAVMIAAPAIAKPTVTLDLESNIICASISLSTSNNDHPALKEQPNWQYTKKLKDYTKGKTCVMKAEFTDWGYDDGDYIIFNLYCECEKGWASVATIFLDREYLRGGQ